MSSPTAFYIPEQSDSSELGQQVRALSLEVASLKTTRVLDDEKIQELEDKFRTHGINAWDSNITYKKDDIVLFGETSFKAGFYKSLKDDNTDHWPSAPESGSWWMIIAGDYVVDMYGDVTGASTSSSVQQVGGATAADIASVTNAIQAGTLNHPTALTIGETAPIVNIGTGATPKTINLGGAGDTVAIAGNLVNVHTDNLQVQDSLVRLNREGLAGSAADAGIEIEEAGAVTAYMKTNGTRDGFVFKAPAASEIAINQSVATNSSPSFQSLTAPNVTSTTGQLILEQTGDTYGSTRFQLRNRTGINGAQLICSADSGVCDIDYLSGTKGIKTRFETRTTGGTADRVVSSENVNGELIVHQSFNHILAMGVNRVTSVKPLTAKAGVNVEGNVSATQGVSGRMVNARGWINPSEPGAYIAWDGNNTGKTHFVTQRGTFEGGWNWLAYDSTNANEGTAMELSRQGHLSVTGVVNANAGLTVSNWPATNINYAFVGRNRTAGSGRMSFGVNRGGGYGGFDWVSYDTDGTLEGTPMTLTRQGNLTTEGSIHSGGAIHTGSTFTPSEQGAWIGWNRGGSGATVFGNQRGLGVGGWEWVPYTASNVTTGNVMSLSQEGNLTVKGTITGQNLVQSTHTMTGSWNGGASPMAANIKATRFGPMVTLTFSGFDGPLTASTVLLTYSQSLPAEYRPPTGGFRSIIQFINGTSNYFVNLHVQDTGGFVIQSPSNTWSTTDNAILPSGIAVTYTV